MRCIGNDTSFDDLRLSKDGGGPPCSEASLSRGRGVGIAREGVPTLLVVAGDVARGDSNNGEGDIS